MHCTSSLLLIMQFFLDAALRILAPVQKIRRASLPKARREAYLNAVRAEINKLPCFHDGNGKVC